MIRFASLLLPLLAATCLSGAASAADCTSPVSASDLVKPGTLVMSTNPTLPPLQYVDKSGQLVGMRIELGREIAKRLDRKSTRLNSSHSGESRMPSSA